MDSRGFERPGASFWVSGFVVVVLKRQWLLYDLAEELAPTCWPFNIPKAPEKVSWILSCVKRNGLVGCTTPLFCRFGRGSS